MSKFDQKNQNVNTQLNADKINIELKSITCPNCQQGNPAKAKYCSECGTSLVFKCPLCNSETSLGAKFCSGCGKEINQIIADIQEAHSQRGGSERELVYEFRSKVRDLLDPISYLATRKSEARVTLEIDEYVNRKEDGIVYFKGGSSTKVADGILYLTNKRLIFLGCDSEYRLNEYEDAYPLNEISDVSNETVKILFLSASLLKIIWNGNVKKFSFARDVVESWVESISTRLPKGHSTKNNVTPKSVIYNSDSNSLKCPQCGLPFKTEESRKTHIANWHK